ncbi:maleylacetoacetate isomerase / glutathione S-transferase [Bdellovibrio bacteriovorus W]|nr:maleylacetoacetate isomerase / glutathione S-transferase [Bdellovibrio bacteriovorus W]
MKSLLLYNYFRSSTSYRARIALHWKGLEFEYKPINLLKSEQRSEEYLNLNPLGGVPTLVHEGRVIPESFAIIEYLDEVFPQNKLLPQDPYLRARVRQFCEVINSSMHPMGNLKVLKHLETAHGYDQAQKDQWVGIWAQQGLKALEIIAQEFAGQYSFGNEVTMADAFLIPQLLTCQRFNIDLTPYPTLLKINDNCLALDAFKKAHPFIQIDTPEDLRK